MKLKKILAGAMAGAMVLGSLSMVSADTADSITGTGDLTPNTGTESLSGDFDVTYTGSEVGGSYSLAPVVELRDADNNCIDFRFDNWGWTYTATDGVVSFTDDQKAITLWPSDVEDGWAGIADQRAAGMTFEANVVRSGDTFYAAFTEYLQDGTAYVTWTYTVDFAAMADDTTITLTTYEGVVLTNIVFTDNNAEETPSTSIGSDTATFGVFWISFTQPVLTLSSDEQTITVTTTSLGSSNWENLIYVLYYSDDAEVYAADSNVGAEANYAEYFVGRADNYGWGDGTFAAASAPADDDAWAEWLAATQSGAEVTISAYLDGDVAYVTLTCEDVTYTATVNVDSSKDVYLALTGENCTLSDLVINGTEDTFVVYDIATDEDDSSDGDDSDGDDTDDSSTGDDSSDDDSDVSYTTVVDTVEIEDLTAEDFWTVFTEGLELVEGQQIVITGTTTNNGTENWNNALFILYSSDDAAIYAADTEEATAANYVEYFVGRLDDYGWGTAAYEVTSYPDDWDAWLAATQAGAEFTITVTYVDDVIQIVSSCEGAEYVMTYTVEDSDAAYYVALSGEQCTLTDLVATYYEAGEDSIVDTSDLTGDDSDANGDDDSDTTDGDDDSDTSDDDDSAVDGDDDDSATDGDDSKSADGDDSSTSDGDNSTSSTSTKKTSDASAAAPIMIALLGCAVVALASKKRTA